MPSRVPIHRPAGWKGSTSTRKSVGWRDDRLRGTSAQRGYGADWRRLRGEVLLRDKGLCQPCLRNGRVTAAREVDHIKPKASGGTDDADNLQAICLPCHRTKTARESRGVKS